MNWKAILIIGLYITLVWPMITGLFTTIIPDLGHSMVNWIISIIINGWIFLFLWKYIKG
jgi:hypothetical protein